MAKVDLDQLIKILNNAQLQSKQPALYQVVKSLLTAITQIQSGYQSEIQRIELGLDNTLTYGTAAWRLEYKPQVLVGNIILYYETDTGFLYVFDSATDTWENISGAPLNATYLTVDDETAILPNSRQLLAGTGITFNDATPGERTISSSGGSGSLIPMTTGEYPPEILGIGQRLMLIPHTGA
jgi:hypothetical protein